ncbi:hypothetical protein IFR05_014496 [Cadophora sp. M221]|nr:hypothetical protein IFR05_014496 [Cadophora sp. M221]
MSTAGSKSLPATSRALVFKSVGQPLAVDTVQTPTPVAGSGVVRTIASTAESSISQFISGGVPGLQLPTPFVLGAGAVARVATTGVDTTDLQVGQLVFLNSFIRGRDNGDVSFLNEDVWRNGTTLEYVLTPLENCYSLNEKALLGSSANGGLGYTTLDLCLLRRHLIAYGGLRGIDLKAGETVIIAPATGAYSGAAVEVASAMGAKVIALGRNFSSLKKLAAATLRVNIVHLQGNPEDDLANIQKFGPVDVFLDISPPAANETTHIRACFQAVKPHGRVSLMGINHKDIAIPYFVAMIKNLTIRGQYMYERDDVRGLINLWRLGC